MRWLACVIVLSALLVGCGPATSTISGEVKVDGKPLMKGVISFAGTGDPVTANVENGHYSVRTTPGKKQVMVSAPVVIGKRPENPGPGAAMVEVTAESLPAK